MTDELPGPMSGRFDDLPNLRLYIDLAPRGIIETRDYERWDPEGPFTNWWWISLRRDDGVWVEGSCQIELAADSVEALELRTAAAIKLLVAVTHKSLRFEALPGELTEPEPPDAEDGDTSTVFAQVNTLCAAAIEKVMESD